MAKRKKKEVNVLKDKIMVSVIMPTYNTPEEYLKKSIESILNQSYKNIEFIIISDGSIQDEKIIKQYNDARIKIIKHRKNEGIAKSLNEAIDMSKGKYIARMDSDDISLRNRIKKQVKYMEKYKNIMVCGMEAKCIGKSNRIKCIYNKKPEEIQIQLLYMNCLIHPSIMMRKSFLDENKIRYNEEYTCSQDFELWARIVEKNNFAIIPKIGLLLRIHNSQISQRKGKIQKELREKIIDSNLRKINIDNNDDNKKLLLSLSGNNDINMSNYESIIKLAANIIDKQEDNTKKTYKKIFYNRIFQIIVSNKELRKNIFNILKEEKKLRSFNNFMYLIYKISKLLEEKIIGLFL